MRGHSKGLRFLRGTPLAINKRCEDECSLNTGTHQFPRNHGGICGVSRYTVIHSLREQRRVNWRCGTEEQSFESSRSFALCEIGVWRIFRNFVVIPGGNSQWDQVLRIRHIWKASIEIEFYLPGTPGCIRFNVECEQYNNRDAKGVRTRQRVVQRPPIKGACCRLTAERMRGTVRRRKRTPG